MAARKRSSAIAGLLIAMTCGLGTGCSAGDGDEQLTPAQSDEEGSMEQPLGISRAAEGQAGCWVTLQWCRKPGLGKATCTQNGGCSCNRFFEVCKSLAAEYCGHDDIAIVC